MGVTPTSVSNFYAQGDDVIFSYPDLNVIQMIIDTYGQLGYEVLRKSSKCSSVKNLPQSVNLTS